MSDVVADTAEVKAEKASEAKLHLAWKRDVKKGGYKGVVTLLMPLKRLDIRRKRPFSDNVEIRRYVFEGELSAQKKGENRLLPFSRAGELGFDVENTRLELRWEEKLMDQEWPWFCHYHLILPTRRGLVLRAALGGTRVGGRGPHISPEGEVDTPFRDGAHALWDGELLGVKAWAIHGPAKSLIKKRETVS